MHKLVILININVLYTWYILTNLNLNKFKENKWKAQKIIHYIPEVSESLNPKCSHYKKINSNYVT